MKKLLIIFFIVFYTSSSFACFCFCPDYKKCYKETDFVFIGRAISVKEHTDIITPNNNEFPRTVNIEVTKYIKGDFINRKIISLFQPRNGCDASLILDSVYVIFAMRMGTSGLLQVKECSGTELLSLAGNHLKLVEGLDTPYVIDYHSNNNKFNPDKLVEEQLIKIKEIENLKINNISLLQKQRQLFYLLFGSLTIILGLILFMVARNKNHK